MTIQELREKLSGMSDKEVKDFCDKFGGGLRPKEDVVRGYAYNPEHELIICYYLNLKTENEKLVEATSRSAEGALKSAGAAMKSAEGATASVKAAWAAVIIALLAPIAQVILGVWLD